MSFFQAMLGAGGISAKLNLSGFTINTTSNYLYWTYSGNNVILERATQSDYSDASQIYSGSALNYTDTGLTIGTTYYYRVKQGNSDWSTVTLQTISFSPDFWFETTGLIYNTNNAFGTLTFGNIDAVKSIINTSGPTANFNTLKWVISQQQLGYFPNANIFNSNNKSLNLSSPVTYTGDFTLPILIKINSTPVFHYICSNTANANQWIRFQSLTTLQFRIGTSGVLSQTFTSALEVGKWYKMVFKRSGSTFSVSVDGGATFSAGAIVGTASHTFDTLFTDNSGGGLPLNCSFIRFMGHPSALTQAKLNEFFNYNQVSTFVPRDAITPSVKGVTFPNALVSGGYFGGTYPHNGIGAYWRDRALIFGKYVGLVLSKQAVSPTYSEDLLRVVNIDSGLITDDIPLGIPYNNTDVHNSGSIEISDNTIYHYESNIHYDQSLSTRFITKRFGDNYNLGNVQTLPILRNMVNVSQSDLSQYLDKSQYVQGFEYNGTKYKIWHGQQRYLFFAYSTDNWNNATVFLLCDSTTNNSFLYPQVVYSQDGYMYCALSHADILSSSRYVESWLFKINLSTLVLSNITASATVNLDPNVTALTLTSLRANYGLVDARALAGSARPGYMIFDPNLNLLYGVVGNGLDTAWQFFTSSGGSGALSFQTIDLAGESIVTADDNDLQVGVLMTSATSGKFYCMRNNAGKWQIVSLSTSNGFANCTYNGVMSQDDTKKHTRITFPKNIAYSDRKVIFCLRELDAATNADIEYFNVT